jgi:EthD domain
MFKQICFFKKRPDMTMEQFLDYYENQHSQLSKRSGRAPSIPNAKRYVRRYLKPEKNPVTGKVIDPGYDCIMEIWWNSREDFENSQKVIANPDRLPAIKEDEARLFASHDNPVCSVTEYDSPMGPNGEATTVELKHRS